MKIPGLTTTRLHLALAALCALTESVEGLVIALLLIAVGSARLVARGYLESQHHMTTPAVAADLAPIPVLAPGRHPA
jgi:hypothetical protein